MGKGEKRQYLLENLIYLIIWLIIFMMPFIEERFNSDVTFEWQDIFRIWKTILPFFILFIINNYILIPYLLIPKKMLLYLVATIALMGAIYPLRTYMMPKMAEMERRIPPDIRREDRVPRFDRPAPRPPFRLHPRMFLLLNFLLITFLVIGLNIAVKLLFKSLRDDHKLKELERHNLQTELEYLKHQINPHFFMNTLNNIHALIDIDTEKAKETVIELSKMMRYVLYDATQPRLPLTKEIQFLNNYIELMSIRYTDKVDIQVSFPEAVPDVMIPPLLFISFVENAFKHGISYRQQSFISLKMEITGNDLHCRIINSSFDKTNGQIQGVGLDNARKRLRLLYGDNYTLQINSNGGKHDVLLVIPLQT